MRKTTKVTPGNNRLFKGGGYIVNEINQSADR